MLSMEADHDLVILKPILTRLFIILFVTLWLFAGASRAQSPSLDSLNQAYQKETSDSLRIKILFKALDELGFDHIDTSFILCHKIFQVAGLIGDTSALAHAGVRISSLHAAQGEFVTALQYDRQALAQMTRLDDKKGIAESYNALGEDYLGLGLYNEAYIHYQRSIEYSKAIEDSLLLTIATYNLGRVFKAAGQLDRAVEYINTSMKMSELIDDQVGVAYSLHDLGDIYLKKGEIDEALKSLEVALQLAEEVDDNIIIPQILDKIAELHLSTGQYEKALNYYSHSYSIYDRQSNDNAKAKVSLGIGRIAMQQNKMEQAKTYLDDALKVAQDNHAGTLLMLSHQELSRWYEKRGNFKRSLELLKRSKVLEDSLTVANSSQQFAQTQVQYELAKKDLAIDELNQKEKARQIQLKNEEFLRNVLVVILAFTAILLVTLYRNSVRNKRANQLLLVHQREIESKTKELQSLLSMKDKFFSIISHDLRSPINALVGILDMLKEGHLTQNELIRLTQSLRVRLDSTRKMLDNLLDWAMMEMNEIMLRREDIQLYNFVQANLLFFQGSSDKEIKFMNLVKEDIWVNADRNMLDLIIRNLISNSIKFTNQGGEIIISSEALEDEMVTVSISDNGVGMSSDMVKNLFSTTTLLTTLGTANEKGRGLGLRLCKEFVEKMGGKIWVESEEGKGSTFKFTIQKAGSLIDEQEQSIV